MSQRTDSIPEPEEKLPFLKRVERFVIDSIGKLILISVLILAGTVAAIFHWGGFVGAPLVHASIRFMFGMESSWDSLDIDWLDRKLTIKNLVMYQPEGYNKKGHGVLHTP